MRFTRRHAIVACGLAAVALGRRITLSDRSSARANRPSEEWKRIAGLIREDPVPIRPAADLVEVVPKEDFHRLLIQMLPLWDSLKTSRVLHAFRLWGPTATFPDDLFPMSQSGRVFSGREMSSYLLDHRFYSALLPSEEPLLYRTSWGVAVRNTPSGHQGQFVSTLAHPDDLLTACGEVGLASTYTIFAADPAGDGGASRATVADMIADSTARFSIHQEMPWSAEAFARYLAPNKSWTNRFGVSFTFDDVVQALLGIPVGAGPCLGTHTIYALVCLSRIDEVSPILSHQSRDRINSHLESIRDRLRAAVVGSGLWSGAWARGEATRRPGSDFEDLSATAHHLEWIALAPPRLRPSTREIERVVGSTFRLLAGGWLARNARSENYLNLSHLARALCLMRNTDPNSFCRGGM